MVPGTVSSARLMCWGLTVRFNYMMITTKNTLKGLSYEIDFENVDKN